MKTPVRFAAVAALFFNLAGITEVEGATYSFSYAFDTGDILTGCLEGTLDTDGNIVVVSSIIQAYWNGDLGPALPNVYSIEGVFAAVEGTPDPLAKPPTVSLDGTVMDLSASTGDFFDGFTFVTDPELFGEPAYASGDSFGATFVPYEPARWTLTESSLCVPEVSQSFWLLGASMGLLFSVRQLAKRIV